MGILCMGILRLLWRPGMLGHCMGFRPGLPIPVWCMSCPVSSFLCGGPVGQGPAASGLGFSAATPGPGCQGWPLATCVSP